MIVLAVHPRAAALPLGTLTHHSTVAGATTATTASFTPQANSILFVDAGGMANNILPGEVTVASLPVLAWTPIRIVLQDPGTGGRCRLGLWYTAIGATPVPMTVTASSALAEGTVVSASSITGAQTDFANIDDDVSVVSAPTPVLPVTPATTSTVRGSALVNTNTSWNNTPGYTDLQDLSVNGQARFLLCFNAGSAAAALPFTSANVNRRAIGIALELKAT